MPALCTVLCSSAQQHIWLWWNLQLLGACEWQSQKSSVYLRGLATGNGVVIVLTDALLAVRHRDADVGVFASVRHQVICLLMATCSSGMFACTRSTDKQGNFIYFNTFHELLSWIAVLAVCADTNGVFPPKPNGLIMLVLQVLVFYFVRCVLAFACCVCELYFYKWVLSLSA